MNHKRNTGLDHLVRANGSLEELRYFPDPIPAAPDPRIERILGEHHLAKRFFDDPRALGIEKDKICSYCGRLNVNGHNCRTSMEVNGSSKTNNTTISSSSSLQLCMICSITNAMCHCFKKPATPSNESFVREQRQKHYFDRYHREPTLPEANQYSFNTNSSTCPNCVESSEKNDLHKATLSTPFICTSCNKMKKHCICFRKNMSKQKQEAIRQLINTFDNMPTENGILADQVRKN